MPAVNHLLQNFTIGGVVVHNQDGKPSKRVLVSHFGLVGCSFPQRKTRCETERAAFVWFAFHPDATSHDINDAFGNRQPETRASKLSRCGTVRLRKSLENRLLLI